MAFDPWSYRCCRLLIPYIVFRSPFKSLVLIVPHFGTSRADEFGNKKNDMRTRFLVGRPEGVRRLLGRLRRRHRRGPGGLRGLRGFGASAGRSGGGATKGGAGPRTHAQDPRLARINEEISSRTEAKPATPVEEGCLRYGHGVSDQSKKADMAINVKSWDRLKSGRRTRILKLVKGLIFSVCLFGVVSKGLPISTHRQS